MAEDVHQPVCPAKDRDGMDQIDDFDVTHADRPQRPGDRLAHHASVHTEFGSNTRDRADTGLMLLTELLEQFHSGFPIHSEPPR